MKKNWRELIGGPNSISLTGWALLFPWSIWLAVGYSPNRTAGASLSWLVLGVAAHCVTGIVLLIAKKTYLKDLVTKRRPFLVLFTYAISGGFRGLTTAYLSVQLGAAQTHNFFPRIPIGFIVTPAWLALTAFIVNAHRQHRSTIHTQLTYKQKLIDARADFEAQIVEYRARLVNQIRSAVQSSLQRVQLAENTAQSLLEVSEEVIRPLSHDLAEIAPKLELRDLNRGNTVKAPSSVGVILKNMRTTAAFPIGYLPVLILLTGLPSSILIAGFNKAFFTIVSGVLLFAAINFLGQRLTLNLRLKLHPIFSWLIVIVFWIGGATTVALINHRGLASSPALSIIGPITFLLILFTTILGSAHSALLLERQNAEIEVRASVVAAEWEIKRAQSVLASEQLLLSETVHSGIQSSFTATALRLAQSNIGQVESADLLAELARNSQELLEAKPLNISFASALDSIAGIWEGVARISASIDPKTSELVSQNARVSSASLAVLREALSNSVRHGRAKNITVSIDLVQDVLEIIVRDDGALKQSEPGLGSELYARLTTSWELSGGIEQETEFRAHIAL